ncbi:MULTISPECIES: metal-dependent hydrolase [unclassified Janthinobacterium]|uniref:metal-dependent hydrolase n=1 Tax=unclassified Janthinobacterium TaxID=2610881 RepID=UPI00160CFA83|nr:MULTISPECIES: metal-dependent hydrolase [unclassified Janthinobacterium]MBB5610478.1 inner membrane protein [Janthinobacterium sp. S3T4]MBB5615860.1 inner membrane protein [Janthinobacterium sp. S3M3]
MDNITHSVIGLAAGELLHRSLPSEPQEPAQRTRRALFLFSAWFASNAPDLDLILTRLLPSPFGYLLHHRGHTHTLLLALPQALLLLAMLWLLWPAARRLLKDSSAARLGLALCMVLGFGLHMGMDFLNSYGIHPFYPFNSRWLYGDMVFIVEPMFWVLLGVPVIASLRSGIVKTVLLAALAAALCFFTYKNFLTPVACIVLLALGALLTVLQGRAGERGKGALLLAFALGATFIGVQGVASAVGRARVEAAVQQLNPGTRVWDVAMTAFPSHPLCWIYVALDSKTDVYTLRRGTMSVFPAALAPNACPAGLAETGQGGQLAPGIGLSAQATGSLASLRQLQSHNCYADAWLRFGRMPKLDHGLTDVRFNPDMLPNFTTIELEQFRARPCPAYVPGWGHPRADMLNLRE